MFAEEGGGPVAVGAEVAVEGEGEAGASVAEGEEFAEEGLHGAELVPGDEVEAGFGEGVAEGDGGEAVEAKIEAEVGLGLGGDEDAGDAAGVKDLLEAAGCHAGGAQGVVFQVVAERGGAEAGAFVIGGEGDGVFPDGAVGVVGEPGEGGAGAGDALALAVGGEAGEVGIGFVAEAGGGGLDERDGLGFDAGVFAQGEGDGGLGEADLAGDVFLRGAGLVHEGGMLPGAGRGSI